MPVLVQQGGQFFPYLKRQKHLGYFNWRCSSVTKSRLYESDINPTYNDLARHYKTVIIPARVTLYLRMSKLFEDLTQLCEARST